MKEGRKEGRKERTNGRTDGRTDGYISKYIVRRHRLFFLIVFHFYSKTECISKCLRFSSVTIRNTKQFIQSGRLIYQNLAKRLVEIM